MTLMASGLFKANYWTKRQSKSSMPRWKHHRWVTAAVAMAVNTVAAVAVGAVAVVEDVAASSDAPASTIDPAGGKCPPARGLGNDPDRAAVRLGGSRFYC